MSVVSTIGGAAPRPPAAPDMGDAHAGSAQLLTFMLGADMFAIGILAVKEIIEYQGVTDVPQMPACISGVINLRGAAVPVLDLARRLERAPSALSKRSCIIVVEAGGAGGTLVIGILVDAVNAVLDIAASDIEPPPSFGARVRPGRTAARRPMSAGVALMAPASINNWRYQSVPRAGLHA